MPDIKRQRQTKKINSTSADHTRYQNEDKTQKKTTTKRRPHHTGPKGRPGVTRPKEDQVLTDPDKVRDPTPTVKQNETSQAEIRFL